MNMLMSDVKKEGERKVNLTVSCKLTCFMELFSSLIFNSFVETSSRNAATVSCTK